MQRTAHKLLLSTLMNNVIHSVLLHASVPDVGAASLRRVCQMPLIASLTLSIRWMTALPVVMSDVMTLAVVVPLLTWILPPLQKTQTYNIVKELLPQLLVTNHDMHHRTCTTGHAPHQAAPSFLYDTCALRQPSSITSIT